MEKICTPESLTVNQVWGRGQEVYNAGFESYRNWFCTLIYITTRNSEPFIISTVSTVNIDLQFLFFSSGYIIYLCILLYFRIARSLLFLQLKDEKFIIWIYLYFFLYNGDATGHISDANKKIKDDYFFYLLTV